MNPFERRGETPQQTGFRFEDYWARFFGQKPTKGSGSLWHTKLDVGTSAILMSLKYSKTDILRWGKRSMRDLFKEVQEAITGPGGIGGETIGAVVTAEEGQIYITFKGEDFLRMAQTGDIHYVTASKGEQKRARARVPALLRDDEDG